MDSNRSNTDTVDKRARFLKNAKKTNIKNSKAVLVREAERNKKSKTWVDLEVFTYYVGANRTEGIGATHIEVSAVQSQENFDVIEAISLDGKQTEKQL